MKFESELKEKSENLGEYLSCSAKALAEPGSIGELYKEKLKPKLATLGYYDNERIKFNVNGYNLIYVNDDRGLMHALIVPGDILSLKNANKLHEREEIEGELEKLGYVLDNSEEFRNLIEKILNNKTNLLSGK